MSLEKKIYENRRIKITYKISQFKIIFIVFLVLFLYYKTKRKKNSFVFSFQFDFFFFLNFYRGILFYCLNILCEMSFFCFSLKVKKVNFDDIFLIFFFISFRLMESKSNIYERNFLFSSFMLFYDMP